MKRMAIIAAVLCMICVGALATGVCTPMLEMPAGNALCFGFSETIRLDFVAGCIVEAENDTYDAQFLLVDTSGFNGCYLLENSGNTMGWESILGGVYVPKGMHASVVSTGKMNCTLTFSGDTGSEQYSFQRLSGEWVLRNYTISKANGEKLFVDVGVREMTLYPYETGERGPTKVYYDFFRWAPNVVLSDLPRSVVQAKQLEQEYPVAAVSPSDPATRVNLRKGPSTKTERVGSLYSGARLHIREIKDGWAKIYVGDTDAYISTDFLTFGEAIEQVEDARPRAKLRDSEWVEISRAPYRGGGGTVSRTEGGQDVRIIGEYNSQWRIVGTDSGSYYIHVDNLQ